MRTWSEEWDIFSDEYAVTAWILLITFYCCAWCLFAHCIVTPLGTCCKRPNNLDEKVFYKRDKDSPPYLSSHRGGGMERAENTLEAFKHSYAKGVNILELDLGFTKDEEVVILHDDDLGRVCGPEYEGKTLSEYDYANLPKLARVFGDGGGNDYNLRSDEIG